LRIFSLHSSLIRLFLLSALPFSTTSNAYEVYDVGTYLNSSTLGTQSLGYLDGVYDDIAGSGIGLSFVNDLDSNGLGTLTWQFANNTSRTLFDVSLFGYLDGDIDQSVNSYFNEYGKYVSVTGSGSADANPDSWEIDEPGFTFGDIYSNMMTGSLDNANSVPAGMEDDVSLALGFDLGNILAGETWTLSFFVSAENIGGLFHGDADSGTGVYVNGAVNMQQVAAVPEPSTWLAFLLGMTGLSLVQRKRLFR
jgi:hypothetical protein